MNKKLYEKTIKISAINKLLALKSNNSISDKTLRETVGIMEGYLISIKKDLRKKEGVKK